MDEYVSVVFYSEGKKRCRTYVVVKGFDGICGGRYLLAEYGLHDSGEPSLQSLFGEL